MKLIKSNCKSIFTKSKLPGCDYVVNQYVGCQHACTYCYAKFICKWKPFGKFGTWVEAKTNAPELVKDKDIKGEVFMSSISDPYQPIEKELKLTREVLKNMNKDIKLSILTKSDLVLRDIDILKEFKNLEIGFTINNHDKYKDFFEPFSPINEKRIKALKELREKGFRTYVFVSPIMPGITDLEKVIESTKDYVDYYWFEYLNLRGAGKEFVEEFSKKFPESYLILKDKEKFREFKEKCFDIISKSKVQYKGIEEH